MRYTGRQESDSQYFLEEDWRDQLKDKQFLCTSISDSLMVYNTADGKFVLIVNKKPGHENYFIMDENNRKILFDPKVKEQAEELLGTALP